jgi:uncharacterized integral membrane protein
MKRFLRVLFLFLAGCLIAAFAVANREPVKFIVDPFINRDIAPSVKAPLFVFLFIALFAGLFLGAAAAWVSQGRWRREAREQSKETAAWKREAETLKAGLEAASGTAVAPVAPRGLRSYL